MISGAEAEGARATRKGCVRALDEGGWGLSGIEGWGQDTAGPAEDTEAAAGCTPPERVVALDLGVTRCVLFRLLVRSRGAQLTVCKRQSGNEPSRNEFGGPFAAQADV